jgi:glycosyltransferase involved in cell wall biosynthesis
MNGLNLEHFGVPDKTYNDPPRVTMMYNSDPRKGMGSGFAALARIKEQYPQVIIAIFGWSRPTGLPFDFEFYHRPTGDRLREVYGATDILLWPSLIEGFGNPPREAMAAQCAVVVSRVGCIPYCTTDGETALWFEPGDSDKMVEQMAWLLDDPTRIQTMGSLAYTHIQQYSWEHAAQELIRFFEEEPQPAPADNLAS